MGGSWGSTLSLTYAIHHPERVRALILRGIFMCRRSELLFFYQNGASHIFPDKFQPYKEHIPAEEQDNLNFAAAFARIECHYFVNGIFLPEGFILQKAEKLAKIPLDIVQGRYDVVCPATSAWELHQALPHSDLTIVPDAGHSMGEVGIAKQLVNITKKYR